MGFELSRNFNHPYLADSPSDFWRRWHISLSTWIRDYIYIPLGGSRGSRAREIVNLFIVFFLTGLWHGASWNFIAWGLYYAVLTVLYRLVDGRRSEACRHSTGTRVVRVLVMLCLTNIGWLIFREHEIGMIWRDLTLSPFAARAADWLSARYLLTLAGFYTAPLVLHLIWDLVLREKWETKLRSGAWTFAGSGIVATAMLFCILLLRSNAAQDFIYFQF